MEELAKLEAERGMPGYVSAGEGIFADGKKKGNKTGKSGGELPVSANGKSGRVASNEMCTFLILNISSLQLIPVNMIAYRSQYGSVNPAGIIARRLWRRLSVRRQRWFIVRGRTGGGEFENNSPPFVQYEKLY